MGNCTASPNDRKTRKYVESRIPENIPQETQINRERHFRTMARNEERRRLENMTEEERIMERRKKREENEMKKQLYNLEKLRVSLHKDVEMFLLNNILFSVQFFENFERERSFFSKVRLEEQSRINAEGPGGGLSSSRHKKRASLPDTMQETVGRWVRLDPPILNSPTFPAKPQEKLSRSRSYVNLSTSSERLDMCKELLAPLRIMVVHQDVSIMEKEVDGELYRAIVPEPSKKPGYVKLRCVGNWEDQSNELYNLARREKEVLVEAEYLPYTDYSESEKIRESESEYSYSCRRLYDKSKKAEYPIEETSSTISSGHSDDEELDTVNTALSPSEQFLADKNKRKGVASISKRPPMLPPQELSASMNHHEFGPQNAQKLDNPPQRFVGRRDSGTVTKLSPWPSMPSTSSSRPHNHNVKDADTTSNKEAENWKLGMTANFGNIQKGFNHSPKPSISTEASDDYGYATIPPSYSPHHMAKRHGGIPQQCLTKVRYRRIDSNDEEGEELDMEGEKLARIIEGQTGNLEKLFITKIFLNPSEFLTAFDEEVRWRENEDSLPNNIIPNSSSELLPELDSTNGVKRQSRSCKNGSISVASVDSGNGTEYGDDSLQARLGIPASVPVVKKGTSWYSQRDRCGMRFPIEIIPSITIPWPNEAKVEWLHRKRKVIIQDIRTDERRPAWPGRLVHEAMKTDCHAIAPFTQQHKKNTSKDNLKNAADSDVPHLGWKLCFCEAERVLEEGLTHAQTRCLLFVLLLRRCYLQWDGGAGLSHNFVRTVFYWQCEHGLLDWPEEEMANNLLSVLRATREALSRGILPDYFMKKKDIAVEEPKPIQRKAQAALSKILDALSIHVARAISGLRFSDSRVPTLDFKKMVQILTDDSTWKSLNPALFAMALSGGPDFEEEEIKREKERSNPGPSGTSQKEIRNTSQKRNPSNSIMPAIRAKFEKENSKPVSNEMFTEFTRIGKRYQINPDEILTDTDDKKDTDIQGTTIKQKMNTIKVVKPMGTISAKKPNHRPEASDAFARLKKTDKVREWNEKYRKELETSKQKKDDKDEPENEDIFAKAETYNPKEVSRNSEKRRLLLSFFAKHFAYLGRRCGRDWGAFRVADAYLRHAENLTTLLDEHERDGYFDDDDEEDEGEAKTIMAEIKKESDILTNLRTKKFQRTAKSTDSVRVKSAMNGIGNQHNLGASMPDLSKQYVKGKSVAKLGSTNSLKERKNLNGNCSTKNDLYSTDDEDEHL